MSARAVVVARAEQQRQHHNGRAADGDAHIAIREPLLEQMADVMEHDAHERRKTGARRAEQQQLRDQQRIRLLRNAGNGKRRCLAAEENRKPLCNDRREHARQQRRVIHHAHAHDLHREHARRERCAEQRRKACRHAAHGDRARILIVQMHEVADVARDRAAELNGRALAAGRAATQMGQHRGDKNARREPQPHRMIPPHRGEDEIRAALERHIHPAVPERDEQTGERQKIQRPPVFGAHLGRPAERVMEGRADCAGHEADDDRENAPADKRAEIAPDAVI